MVSHIVSWYYIGITPYSSFGVNYILLIFGGNDRDKPTNPNCTFIRSNWNGVMADFLVYSAI